MRRRVDHQAGFVLHTYPYKETSLIVEALTREHGRVALLARGARRPRAAMRGVLLSFHPLRLGWSGAAELRTLVTAEWAGNLAPLRGVALMCGFYLNELLLRMLPREDPHEALFDAYAEGLARLCAGSAPDGVLRGFEKRLLAELGYAPMFDRDAASGAPIDPARRYVYDPDRGPVAGDTALASEQDNSRGGPLTVSGRTLLDLAHDEFARPATRDEARALMRALIAQRLHGQTLHTRAVLLELNAL